MLSCSNWFDCIPGGLTLSMYICNTRSLVHSNLTSKETMIWWKQNSIFNSCWNTEFIPTHGCIDNRFKWMIRWGKTNILAFRAEKNYSKKKPKKTKQKTNIVDGKRPDYRRKLPYEECFMNFPAWTPYSPLFLQWDWMTFFTIAFTSLTSFVQINCACWSSNISIFGAKPSRSFLIDKTSTT